MTLPGVYGQREAGITRSPASHPVQSARELAIRGCQLRSLRALHHFSTRGEENALRPRSQRNDRTCSGVVALWHSEGTGIRSSRKSEGRSRQARLIDSTNRCNGGNALHAPRSTERAAAANGHRRNYAACAPEHRATCSASSCSRVSVMLPTMRAPQRTHTDSMHERPST
jgi:hypothetical protein